MLIPVLMAKIPNEIKLVLSREKDWTLKNILKCFKKELEAREKVAFSSKNNESSAEANSGEHLCTGSSLLTSSQQKNSFEKKCVFCFRQHKEQYCDLIKNERDRKNVLLKENRCF